MYLLQWPASPHVKAKIRSFQVQLKFEAIILNQKQLVGSSASPKSVHILFKFPRSTHGEVKANQMPTKNIKNTYQLSLN